MNKFKIICISDNADSAQEFTKRNLGLSVDHIFGTPFSMKVVEQAIFNDEYDYLLIVQANVVFPRNFTAILDKLISRLNSDWPHWGASGNSGLSVFKFGITASDTVRMYATPFSGPNIRNVDVPCSVIGINTILVNARALRERLNRCELYRTNQPYSIILSHAVIEAKCSIIAVPELTCFVVTEDETRNVAPRETLVKSFLKRKRVTKLIASDSKVSTPLENTPYSAINLDLGREALRNAGSGNKKRSLDIIIRTQFRSLYLLSRSLKSINEFAAKCAHIIETNVVLISDRKLPNEFDTTGVNEFLKFDFSDGGDTRYRLVLKYIDKVKSDFSWFVDDDDWIFEDIAIGLALTLNAAPSRSIILCDTQHFHETLNFNKKEVEIGSDLKPGRIYESSRWWLSIGHENYIPFPGMVFSRYCLYELRDKVGSDNIMYLEDHYMLQNTILNYNVFPIIFDRTSVGISIRSLTDDKFVNSVTEVDRTNWHISAAQKYWVLNNSNFGSPLYPSSEQIKQSLNSFNLRSDQLTVRKKKNSSLLQGIYRISSIPSAYRQHWDEILQSYRLGGIKAVRRYIRSIGE